MASKKKASATSKPAGRTRATTSQAASAPQDAPQQDAPPIIDADPGQAPRMRRARRVSVPFRAPGNVLHTPAEAWTDAELDALDAAEAEELERGSSPLYLMIGRVGCQLASEGHVAGSVMPTYRFHTPCVYGKVHPDQHCRDCVYVKLTPLGAERPLHDNPHRWPHAGAVWPLPDEAVADEVVATLAARGVRPLTRPHRTAYHRRLNVLPDEQARAARAARAAEEQHAAGRLALPPAQEGR